MSSPWVVQLNGTGTVAIDGSSPAHSGTKSVRVHAADADYDTLFALRDATVLPAPGGRFFLRAYMRLGRAMAGGHNSFIIADPFATLDGYDTVRFGFEKYAGPGLDIWYDDIADGTERIGCN